jgi:chromosome segregation ATPase
LKVKRKIVEPATQERSQRVDALEKQVMKNKADLEAKDKMIERECKRVEKLTSQVEELALKNRQLEELLEQRATEAQQMSVGVSKMLKDFFGDYESHSVTQPSLQAKL